MRVGQTVENIYDAATVAVELESQRRVQAGRLLAEAEMGLAAPPRRRLLSGGCDCPAVASEPWVKQGGVLVFVAGVLFVFLGLALVCDDYFVASLEAITEKLQLSEDVAGATFMAAGSSAPELFTSFTSLLNPDTSDSMGTATIVGSAVFNVLVIIGATGLFAGQVLFLDWKPLVRDGLFYLVCVVLLVIFFDDGKVELYEAAALVGAYGSYVGFMKVNRRVFGWMDSVVSASNKVGDYQAYNDACEAYDALPISTAPPAVLRMQGAPSEAHDFASLSYKGKGADRFVAVVRLQLLVWRFISKMVRPIHARSKSERWLNILQLPSCSVRSARAMAIEPMQELKDIGGVDRANDDADPFKWPTNASFQDQALWILSQPFYYAFWATIPDCRREGWEGVYLLTFAGSIVWIAGLSWVMVDWTNTVGCVLEMPPVTMGVLVLAAGTSIPDALGSLAVAKNGQGDMAVSNAIGSNVFDILLGLGLPWLVVILWRGDDISIEKDDLYLNIGFLFAVLVIYFGIVMLNGRRLNRTIGGLLCACYAGFVLFQVIYSVTRNRLDC